MPIPNLPVVAQINWPDSDPNPPWSQATVDLFAPYLQRVEIEQRAFRGSLRSDTCTLTFRDVADDLIPSKAASALAGDVVLGRRVRVLRQTALGSGVWEPWFSGYIRDYQPDMVREFQASNVILCDGPLAALADMEVAVPPSTNMVVHDPDALYRSGLYAVLHEAGLWDTPFVEIGTLAAATLPDDWAGTLAEGADPFDTANWTVKTFAEWLSILTRTGGFFVADEPRLAVAAGDPDWVLRCYQPNPEDAATFSLSAPDGDLETTPRVSYSGEVSF